MSIKIAYLDYSHIFAGAERVLYTIISHLDKTVYEPILVFPYPMEHQKEYLRLGCEVVYLSDSLKWWMGSDRWKHPVRGTDFLMRTILGYRLKKKKKKNKIDILHVNLLRPDSLMWIYFAKRLGIKIIGHFRSQALSWIPPKIVQRNCDLILCVSQYSRRRMLIKGEYTESKVLYDSIDIDSFKINETSNESKKKLGFPETCFLISSIGQLSRHKGHDNAIRAFAKIALVHPQTVLFIAGGGTDLKYLEQLVSELPSAIKERIFFTKKQLSNIIEVYNASDLVLSLTKVGEAFGLVPFESAIMGKPFIAPNKGAVKEFIENKRNGILVDTENVDEITTAIDWIIKNPMEVKKMNSLASQLVQEKLTPSVMISNLENIYRSC